MIPARAWDWIEDADTLMRVACWLRDQRAGRYPQLIQAKHLEADDADRDERARAAIAAEWEAIFWAQPPHEVATTTTAERDWCLDEAIRITGLHVDRAADPTVAAHLAHVRDAIGALLLWERDGAIARTLRLQKEARHLGTWRCSPPRRPAADTAREAA